MPSDVGNGVKKGFIIVSLWCVFNATDACFLSQLQVSCGFPSLSLFLTNVFLRHGSAIKQRFWTRFPVQKQLHSSGSVFWLASVFQIWQLLCAFSQFRVFFCFSWKIHVTYPLASSFTLDETKRHHELNTKRTWIYEYCQAKKHRRKLKRKCAWKREKELQT